MSTTVHRLEADRHYRDRPSVIRTLAERLGRSPATTHQLLDGPTGPVARTETILYLLARLGPDGERLAHRRILQMQDAIRRGTVEALTPAERRAVADRAQVADMHEDVVESRFWRGEVDRDEYKRAVDQEIVALMALRDALTGAR